MTARTHSRCFLRHALAAALVGGGIVMSAQADQTPAARRGAASNKLALVKVLLNGTPSVTRIEQGSSEEAKALLGAARVAYAEASRLCDRARAMIRARSRRRRRRIIRRCTIAFTASAAH